MGAVGVALGLFGGIASAVSASNQSRYNAGVARQQAEAVQASNAMNQQIRRRRVAQALGAQRYAAAAGGVGLGGSIRDVLLDTAYEAEMQSRIDQYNTDVKVSQLYSKADQLESQAGSQLFGGILGSAGSAFTNLALINQANTGVIPGRIGTATASSGGYARAIKP